MRDINNYEVFKKAHSLTLKIYDITKNYPKEEQFGLALQMRRAAYLIPMNLKEGGIGNEVEFFRYVRIAIGSKEELEYQILLSKDLGYISEKIYKYIVNYVPCTCKFWNLLRILKQN
jgi:four helix bundle protein